MSRPRLIAALLVLLASLIMPARVRACGLYPGIAGVEGLPYCAAVYTLYVPAVYN